MATNARPDNETAQPSPNRLPAKEKKKPAQPPDSIPDIMPGVDPEQTPGTDRPPAENDPNATASTILDHH